jgi:hemolysin III
MGEIKNYKIGILHLILSVLALAGLAILVVFASIFGDVFDIVSFSIYGSALFLMFLFSTLYHWLRLGEKGTCFFRKFNLILVYVLIASSYMPMALGPLRGPLGWTFFGIVWGLSILGIILSAIWTNIPKVLSSILYLVLGWLVVIIAYPLIKILTTSHFILGLVLFIIAGVSYTISGILYCFNNRVTNILFHIFVTLGTICYYIFVLFYVLKI